MQSEIKCPRCIDKALIAGFVVDRGSHGVKQEQIWVEGEPESSIWTGIKTSGKEIYNVRARRCADCNYLELYTADRIYL